jgi:anti-sigma factor RsiW
VSCENTQGVLNGYIDGELDVVRSLEVEAHLESCPVCSKIQRDLLAIRERFNSGDLYFNAPPGLERRIRAALPKPSRTPWLPFPARWAAAAVSVAAVAAVAIAVWRLAPRSGETMLAQEVVSSHIRSLMPGHLTDVGSSDQHTVKPWFAGKLDFSPVVKDMAAEGYPLAGGRLDYIGGRPVAALVYQRRKHVINVFTWPLARESRTVETEHNGYHILHWSHAGMAWWAVSDVNRSDLEEFTRLLRGG